MTGGGKDMEEKETKFKIFNNVYTRGGNDDKVFIGFKNQAGPENFLFSIKKSGKTESQVKKLKEIVKNEIRKNIGKDSRQDRELFLEDFRSFMYAFPKILKKRDEYVTDIALYDVKDNEIQYAVSDMMAQNGLEADVIGVSDEGTLLEAYNNGKGEIVTTLSKNGFKIISEGEGKTEIKLATETFAREALNNFLKEELSTYADEGLHFFSESTENKLREMKENISAKKR